MDLSELFFTKEMVAAVVGAVVSSVFLIVGGLSFFLHSEKKRQRVEIFSKLAAVPIWTAEPRASELLSAIPTVFSKSSDGQVRIATETTKVPYIHTILMCGFKTMMALKSGYKFNYFLIRLYTAEIF